jgi:hypothetical protein
LQKHNQNQKQRGHDQQNTEKRVHWVW